MKQFIKRIGAVALAATLLLSLLTGVAATYVELPKTFGSFSGSIKTVNPVDANGTQMVLAETNDGQRANITITPKTAKVTGNAPVVGANIVAIYDATLPMLMIYPPQYSTLAVAIGMEEGKSIKIDRFDKSGLSSDGSLVIRTSSSTKIIGSDGRAYTGSIANKTLLIVYEIVLDSYPAQTGPELIVVLGDLPVAVAGEAVNKAIVVNGKTIKAAKPFLTEKGVIMVPLTPIARALKAKVVYFGNSSKAISFRVGKDSYKVPGQKEPISLGTPSVRKGGVIYVPLDFFRVVLRADMVFVDNTQITINME